MWLKKILDIIYYYNIMVKTNKGGTIMEKLNVVFKSPNEAPSIKEVVDDLSTWQGLVGGYIEVVPYGDENLNILVICNEEGKLKGLQPNIYYYSDILVGNIVFVSSNAEGDFIGLNKQQIIYVLNTLLYGGLKN